MKYFYYKVKLNCYRKLLFFVKLICLSKNQSIGLSKTVQNYHDIIQYEGKATLFPICKGLCIHTYYKCFNLR